MKTYSGNSDTVWQELTTINVEIKGICSSEWFYRGCHTFILYVGILKVISLILDAILLFLLAIVSFSQINIYKSVRHASTPSLVVNRQRLL